MGEILNYTEPCGIVIVNKHAGCTSHDIVNKIRRLYNTKRVGHTGTLDPMATGVLVVLVGRAAKAAELIPSDRKCYRAVLKLGIETTTEDITGSIINICHDIPTANSVISACTDFVGTVFQTPPMYSAIKIGGKKLCDLARKGETIDRPERAVNIYSISCVPTAKNDEYILDVDCSGGTYIRTLCSDIGKKLNCGGAMASLTRTSACGFSISESHTVEELTNMNEKERADILIPLSKLFSCLPSITLSAFFERLFRSGCEIYQRKLGTSLPDGALVSICGEACGFFAIGKVCEYENGSAIKPIKQFYLN